MTDLLNVEDLAVEFRVQAGKIVAVEGVSFRVKTASTVAIVGESGSGKSTIAQAIMGILPNVAEITRGSIKFTDPNPRAPPSARRQMDPVVDIASLPSDGWQMQRLRGGRMSMIFQEPMTSLSPLHTIGDQISEAMLLHSDVTKKTAMEAVEECSEPWVFPIPKRASRTIRSSFPAAFVSGP